VSSAAGAGGAVRGCGWKRKRLKEMRFPLIPSKRTSAKLFRLALPLHLLSSSSSPPYLPRGGNRGGSERPLAPRHELEKRRAWKCERVKSEFRFSKEEEEEGEIGRGKME
jgi:hypothetical protein